MDPSFNVWYGQGLNERNVVTGLSSQWSQVERRSCLIRGGGSCGGDGAAPKRMSAGTSSMILYSWGGGIKAGLLVGGRCPLRGRCVDFLFSGCGSVCFLRLSKNHKDHPPTSARSGERRRTVHSGDEDGGRPRVGSSSLLFQIQLILTPCVEETIAPPPRACAFRAVPVAAAWAALHIQAGQCFAIVPIHNAASSRLSYWYWEARTVLVLRKFVPPVRQLLCGTDSRWFHTNQPGHPDTFPIISPSHRHPHHLF